MCAREIPESQTCARVSLISSTDLIVSILHSEGSVYEMMGMRHERKFWQLLRFRSQLETWTFGFGFVGMLRALCPSIEGAAVHSVRLKRRSARHAWRNRTEPIKSPSSSFNIPLRSSNQTKVSDPAEAFDKVRIHLFSNLGHGFYA